jgi:hypothetical protein
LSFLILLIATALRNNLQQPAGQLSKHLRIATSAAILPNRIPPAQPLNIPTPYKKSGGYQSAEAEILFLGEPDKSNNNPPQP